MKNYKAHGLRSGGLAWMLRALFRMQADGGVLDKDIARRTG
jgi:hypothetical protein